MEQRFMGVVTASIAVITIAICFLLVHFPNFHLTAMEFQDSLLEQMGRQSVYETVMENDVSTEESTETGVDDLLEGHQIRMQLPQKVSSKNVSIENDYVNRLVTITIKGIGKNYFDEYPVYGMSNDIVDITYESESLVGVIQITLDDVLEVEMTEEDNNIYFDFVDPHDIYDYVIAVDAGHGGSVPGATKMGVNEKDINLALTLALKKYFDASDKNIGVYYTRTTDCNPSFASRVNLPNDLDADLYISIHNNSTASGRMSSISGTEVMYRGADTSGESKRFATMCLNNLTEALGTKSKGTVVGDEIYIIRESKAPVALVEVGFMTNKTELAELQDSEYQDKAAKAIYDAAIEYLYE